MGLDLTPAHASDRLMVQAYGDGSFKIGDTYYRHSVILFGNRVVPWNCYHCNDLTLPKLLPVVQAEENIELLLVGCGLHFEMVPVDLREKLNSNGMALEWMDTPAACRTYNVLQLEERCFAAAMIVV